jgi:UDPglucose 6-dehydrogenase
LIQRLVGAGATIAAHDPKAVGTAREVLGERNITYCEDMYAALDGAHALVVCTEWPQYRTPDFQRIKQALVDGVVFDGRNLYDLDWMRELGLVYMSVGRPVVCADPQRLEA